MNSAIEHSPIAERRHETELPGPARPSGGLATADRSSVFVIKSLLYPVVAVLTLVCCLMLWREPFRGPYLLIGVMAFVGTADFIDLHAVQMGHNGSRFARAGTFANVLLHWLVVVAIIWALLHLSGIADRVAPGPLIVWAVTTPIALSFSLLAANTLLRRTAVRHFRPRHAAIVGVTEMGLRLMKRLCADEVTPTVVVGFFEDRSDERVSQRSGGSVRGRLSDVPDFVKDNRVDVVYITLPMTRHPRIVGLLDALRDSTASIYFVPDLAVFNLIQGRFDQIQGIPVVAVCESPFYGLNGLVKRASDIAIAAAIVLLTAPLLLALALGVRLSSPGPVLFRQKRYGLDGQGISVYKFRSMTVTEDGEMTYTQVTRNDARVTRFGDFMRRTSLDELPQFFNVLKGSMSIVGPRPHAVAVNEQYRRLIPGYMVRHKVKPGITGWAQINGYRGGDDLDSMKKRIEFDLDYLRQWSLGFDLMIILKTATVLVGDRRAF